MQRIILTALLLSLAWPADTPAQAPPIAAPTEVKTLAATMNVYVFPAEGQSQEVQNRHEAECYAWAVNHTKSDPFELARQAEQQARGAEAQKAAVQEQGKGAGGAIAGRRRARRAQQQATQQIDQQTQQVQQATAEQIENFKKAFSVCLEAKKYMVKM